MLESKQRLDYANVQEKTGEDLLTLSVDFAAGAL